MSNTDDENIQKISRMLEIGGTMLAQHCGNCGAPLFRYQGRVLCPVCEDVRDPRAGSQPAPAATPSLSAQKSTSTVKVKDGPVAASPESPAISDRSAPRSSPAVAPIQGSLSETQSLLVSKMTSIAHEMQKESDPRRIAESLDLIDRLMDIISKMSN